jgi:hypothetical protein
MPPPTVASAAVDVPTISMQRPSADSSSYLPSSIKGNLTLQMEDGTQLVPVWSDFKYGTHIALIATKEAFVVIDMDLNGTKTVATQVVADAEKRPVQRCYWLSERHVLLLRRSP